MSRLRPEALRAVFGSANGDGTVMHAILESLAAGEGHVSPTQFHNSVHNAAAGYWTIATGSRQSATAVGCHDSTVGMALLNAVTEMQVEQAPVLLCVYDLPLPEPLHAKRPVQHGFAAALILAPSGEHGCAVAEVKVAFSPSLPSGAEGRFDGATLRRAPSPLLDLTRGNPAARMLPLLESLAGVQAEVVSFTVPDGQLRVAVTPCLTAGRSPP